MLIKDINLRRAVFVYEAARLEAKLSGRRVVPEAWEERDKVFQEQCVKMVAKQCGKDKFESAEEAHNNWWKSYIKMGWVYGEKRDPQKKTHPDMVPFSELPKDERDKDEIYIRLCAVAEAIS